MRAKLQQLVHGTRRCPVVSVRASGGLAAGDYPCSSLRLFILASTSGCSQVSDVSHTQVTRYSARQKPRARTNLFNIVGNQHTFT